MQRYAPTVKDLAPRDMIAKAMLNEGREGCGPYGAYVMLDPAHLEPARTDARPRDITRVR
jgi:succinate dehydrogenase / fumarate reductase, flavoprotein subunit